MSPVVSDDLSKLTVQQLKALCRDRHITGYSKLGKTALLSKLASVAPQDLPASRSIQQTVANVPHDVAETRVSAGNPSSVNLAPAAVSQNCSSGQSEVDTERATGPTVSPFPYSSTQDPQDPPRTKYSSSRRPSDRDADSTSPPTLPVPLSRSGLRPPAIILPSSGLEPPLAIRSVPLHVPALAPSATVSMQKNSAAALEAIDNPANTDLGDHFAVSSTKRPLQAATHTPSPAKKSKKNAMTSYGASSAATLPSSRAFKTPKLPPALQPTSTGVSGTAELPPSVHEASRDRAYTQAKTTSLPGKRFKPLKITKAHPQGASAARSTMTAKDSASVSALSTGSLEFYPPVPPPVLAPISFPPSLSQRKLVPRWVLILSGLSNRECRQCALVSKMIRYAVYLSAQEILAREYAGRRLDTIREQFTPRLHMMNMWPFLRLLEAEIWDRRAVVDASFLGAMYKGRYPLEARLWASPDHERQLSIAVRFLVTRVWFAISVGSTRKDPLAWLRDTVLDAKEVVKGEIWAISVLSSTSSMSQTIYVLEATCEPIGHAPLDTTPPALPSTSDSYPLRADWAQYLSRFTSSACGQAVRVLDSMKWADHAEYARGVSRHWLSRMASKGTEGSVLVSIAERYVMACVVGNGLSGRWMSTTQMAQDFAGLAERSAPGGRAPEPQLGMFLPSHHHVESVHLTASGGGPLHPALAVVQTPAREYIILRDNGMQVGCEEDGVGEVWKRLLGCDGRGVRVDEGGWFVW